MADWPETLRESIRQDALEECQRCRGREHGDCSDQCRYWGATASRAEREELVTRTMTRRILSMVWLIAGDAIDPPLVIVSVR